MGNRRRHALGCGRADQRRGPTVGVISVASGHGRPLSADTEERLAGFTELVATAIANAEAQTQLTASRASGRYR